MFITGVYDSVVSKGYWRIVGRKRPVEDYLIEMSMGPIYTEDLFLDKCIIHYFDGSQKIVEREKVRGMESATVWDYGGMEKRLSDYYAGRFNQKVDYMLQGKQVTGMHEQSRMIREKLKKLQTNKIF